MICSICGNEYDRPGLHGKDWCLPCEVDRIKLGEAFLAETGSTWLYDKGEFVLKKVRAILDDREAFG